MTTLLICLFGLALAWLLRDGPEADATDHDWDGWLRDLRSRT